MCVLHFWIFWVPLTASPMDSLGPVVLTGNIAEATAATVSLQRAMGGGSAAADASRCLERVLQQTEC